MNYVIIILGNTVPDMTLEPCVSCQHRCGSRMGDWGSQAQCFCDHQCLLYGDCCYDYGILCDGDTAKDDGNVPDNTTVDFILATMDTEVTRNRYDFECLRIPLKDVYEEDHRNYKWYLLVTQCASHVPPEYKEAQEKCGEDYELSTDITVRTPALYHGIFYKNVHCLVCSVGVVNASEVRFPETSYECYNESDAERAKELYVSHSFAEFQEYLGTHCRFYTNPVADSVSEWTNPGMSHAALCDPNRITSCNVSSFSGSSQDFDYYDRFCRLYESIVSEFTDTGREVYFKNQHCAACNNYNNVSCKAKPHDDSMGGAGGLPSFSLIMNFGGAQEDDMKFADRRYCKSNEYLDAAHDKCVVNTCPTGQVTVDDQCVKLNINVSEFTPNLNLTDWSYTRALLKFGLAPEMILNDNVSEIMADFADAFFKRVRFRRVERAVADLHCQYDLENHIRPMTSSSSSSSSSGSSGSSNTTACALVYIGTNYYGFPLNQWIHKIWGESLSSQLEEFKDKFTRVAFKYLMYDPVPQGHDLCPSGRPVVSENLVFVRLNVETFSQDPDAVLDNVTGLFYEYKEVHMGVEFTTNGEGSETDMVHYGVFCQPHVLFCNRTLVDVTLLPVDASINGSSLYIGNAEVRQGYFIQLSMDKYLLCVEAFDAVRRLFPNEPESLDSRVQGILTLIGNILSIIFLSFTFTTYLVFPSMKTVPGICIMNLCVSLSLSQLLFQLGPLFAVHSVVCSVMAAIQHYTWLVSFLWMNVLSYITFRTFSQKGIVQGPDKSKLIRFSVYAWGLPLVFTISCVCVDKFTSFPFSYGGSSQCWLSGKNALVYFFAVPLAVIITTNICLFTRTMVAIKRTMDQAKMAKSGKDEQKQFSIYVKLSSVMGFTWLFGFLANLTVFTAFWYVFIVLNTFQGVFIALSFALNGRVLKKYKSFITGKPTETSTGTLNSKSTRQTSIANVTTSD